MEERREPVWIPYDPPPQSRSERLTDAVRHYGFAVACVVLLILAGALLSYYSARPEGAPSDEELALLAEQLAAHTEGPRIYEGDATLTIATLPSDAVVLIDQEPSGISPMRRFSLPAGVHRITIQKEGYTSVDSIVAVRSDRPEAFYVPLTKVLAQTEPPRSATAQQRPAERLEQKEEAESEKDAAQEVPAQEVPAQAVSAVLASTAEAAPRGAVRITSQPAGAAVQVDGRAVGTTPLTVQEVPPGEHAVTMQADAHRDFARSVTVRPGETEALEGRLTALEGTLSVLVRPWGTIAIDGEVRRRETDVRYVTMLPAGPHRLTVTHPVLGTWEQEVDVHVGGTSTFVVDFNVAQPGALTASEEASAKSSSNE